MNNINEISKWSSWLLFSRNRGMQCKSLGLGKRGAHSNYYFIFDYKKNSIDYACDCFEKILGYNKDAYSLMDIIGFMHPTDSDYVLNCERKAVEFLSSLNTEEIFNYSISYSYRTMTKYGNYIRVRQSCQVLEVDVNGRMCKSLVFNEVLNDVGDNFIENDFKIMERQTNSNITVVSEFNLTKREAEVLALIKEGLTSVEISNRLYVSKFTVDTHRKNILAKTNNKKFITIIKEGIA